MADNGGLVDLLNRTKEKAMGFMGKLERAGNRIFSPSFGPQGMKERAKMKARRLKQAGIDAITPSTPPPRPKSDISQIPRRPKRSMKHLTKGRM